MSDKARPLMEAPKLRASKFPTLLAVVSLAATISIFLVAHLYSDLNSTASHVQRVPIDTQSILEQCMAIKERPAPAQGFVDRDESDRYEPGTKPTVIRNAKIFTGEKNGTVILHGDVYMEKGVIKGVGRIPRFLYEGKDDLKVINANGGWVTPGLVDIHSHLGLLSAPLLAGAIDVDSKKGPILPWLRSVDAFNTHDDGFELAIAGGVTSVQVLPGSGNAIGGQAFIMKLRKTSERSVSSMLVEPPNELTENPDKSPRWRHMKHACGENLRAYGNRMDSAWSLRSAYHEAKKLKDEQDDYCAKAEAGLWGSLTGPFPKNLQWEALVDVLRGRVKVSAHCYEAVDLDSMVRLSKEFKFPIASFHHAAEAWLVPDLLKQTHEGTPAVALLANNYRYKREAFRGSEFAPRVLADEGIPVIMKSDHPFTNSRYLIYEAQQAHHFGLPPSLALAAVTSAPAKAMGLVHRIGVIDVGADADVVLWDSHPLHIGATPVHVWIDGVMQIPLPPKNNEDTRVEVGVGKEGDEWQRAPDVPNWEKERKEALMWEGLPPLRGRKVSDRVAFQNVREIWHASASGVQRQQIANELSPSDPGEVVVVEKGRIVCVGTNACANSVGQAEIVDLRGGSISPGLMTYGSSLGLEEMRGEPSTGDGKSLDAFNRDIPDILHDVGNTLRAMDALIFGTRNALLAYRHGVTMATASLQKHSPVEQSEIISGLSVSFRTGSPHVIDPGAIIQDVSALHVSIGRKNPAANGRAISVSSQIGGLRRLLYGWESHESETGHWFRKAAEGVVPLVIEVHSADIMASLLIVKAEVEDKIGSNMRMVFSGATEAHLLAKEIANERVGVILNPVRPFPETWQQRRILAGPPISNDTALVKLLRSGVIVALGVRSSSEVRNTRFDLQWAMLESNGRIDQQKALQMVTTDLEDLLGIRYIDEDRDLVAYEGGNVFDSHSKVIGVISQKLGTVDLF